MKIIVDNNLPLVFTRRLRENHPDVDISHVSDFGAEDWSDQQFRQKWRGTFIVWISRDEDFWIDSPPEWAVIWVSCHNPKLAYLRDVIASAVNERLTDMSPGKRLMISEQIISYY